MKQAGLVVLTTVFVLLGSVSMVMAQGRGHGPKGMPPGQQKKVFGTHPGQGQFHRSRRGLDRESARARIRQNPRSVEARTTRRGHRGLKLGHVKRQRSHRTVYRRHHR